jgi:DNA processing protein
MSTPFAINRMKINDITPDKHKYLQITSHIPNPPKRLYYIGNLPEKRVPTIAIVGTRKPTTYGVEVTNTLTYELASKGVVVVSGLALGTDALVHKAALSAKGVTIAVLPCGLNTIAPRTNRSLAIDIISHGGALVSEYHVNDEVAWKSNMHARNRIVSGLSDAILITEASARSGTLNTAAHALAQGKTVFVVPGNITSPSSAGCNALLKQGATPVTEAADILQVIAPGLVSQQATLALGANPIESKIIELLDKGVRDGEQIQRELGLETGEFNTALTMLELSGAIRALGANQWTLR